MDDNQEFGVVRADDNKIYYCPLGVAPGLWRTSVELPGDCIEADVVERYSGHLNIVK